MKFYCSHLLVLCGSAAAFMAPAKNVVTTKLNSSPQPSYFGSQTQQAAPGAPGAPLSTSGPSDLAPGAMLTDADIQFAGHVANMGPDQRIQGGALRTWSFDNAERLVVKMSSDDRTLQNDVIQNEGRHMKVLLELCEGPDNTPLRMEVVSGKGKLRPFKAVIETPKRYGSLFLRNIGDLEFPITAAVNAAADLGPGAANAGPIVNLADDVYDMRAPEMLQGGGSVISFPLDPQVKSAKVQLKTDGRPLNAKVSLCSACKLEAFCTGLLSASSSEAAA